jgi:Fic family protein
MKSQRNPWQKLLQEHIHNRFTPPRPEGYYTRPEIAKLWGLKINTTSRLLKDMLKAKKLEMRKHPFLITTTSKPSIRQLKIYKILSTKPPHK